MIAKFANHSETGSAIRKAPPPIECWPVAGEHLSYPSDYDRLSITKSTGWESNRI